MIMKYKLHICRMAKICHIIPSIPWNKHQDGKLASIPSCVIDMFLKDPASITIEELLSALMRFRRPDQMLLVEVHTVFPVDAVSQTNGTFMQWLLCIEVQRLLSESDSESVSESESNEFIISSFLPSTTN